MKTFGENMTEFGQINENMKNFVKIVKDHVTHTRTIQKLEGLLISLNTIDTDLALYTDHAQYRDKGIHSNKSEAESIFYDMRIKAHTNIRTQITNLINNSQVLLNEFLAYEKRNGELLQDYKDDHLIEPTNLLSATNNELETLLGQPSAYSRFEIEEDEKKTEKEIAKIYDRLKDQRKKILQKIPSMANTLDKYIKTTQDLHKIKALIAIYSKTPEKGIIKRSIKNTLSQLRREINKYPLSQLGGKIKKHGIFHELSRIDEISLDLTSLYTDKFKLEQQRKSLPNIDTKTEMDSISYRFEKMPSELFAQLAPQLEQIERANIIRNEAKDFYNKHYKNMSGSRKSKFMSHLNSLEHDFKEKTLQAKKSVNQIDLHKNGSRNNEWDLKYIYKVYENPELKISPPHRRVGLFQEKNTDKAINNLAKARTDFVNKYFDKNHKESAYVRENLVNKLARLDARDLIINRYRTSPSRNAVYCKLMGERDLLKAEIKNELKNIENFTFDNFYLEYTKSSRDLFDNLNTLYDNEKNIENRKSITKDVRAEPQGSFPFRNEMVNDRLKLLKSMTKDQTNELEKLLIEREQKYINMGKAVQSAFQFQQKNQKIEGINKEVEKRQSILDKEAKLTIKNSLDLDKKLEKKIGELEKKIKSFDKHSFYKAYRNYNLSLGNIINTAYPELKNKYSTLEKLVDAYQDKVLKKEGQIKHTDPIKMETPSNDRDSRSNSTYNSLGRHFQHPSNRHAGNQDHKSQKRAENIDVSNHKININDFERHVRTTTPDYKIEKKEDHHQVFHLKSINDDVTRMVWAFEENKIKIKLSLPDKRTIHDMFRLLDNSKGTIDLSRIKKELRDRIIHTASNDFKGKYKVENNSLRTVQNKPESVNSNQRNNEKGKEREYQPTLGLGYRSDNY